MNFNLLLIISAIMAVVNSIDCADQKEKIKNLEDNHMCKDKDDDVSFCVFMWKGKNWAAVWEGRPAADDSPMDLENAQGVDIIAILFTDLDNDTSGENCRQNVYTKKFTFLWKGWWDCKDGFVNKFRLTWAFMRTLFR